MRPHDASIPPGALTNGIMNYALPTSSHFSSSLQPFSAPDSCFVPISVPSPADAVVDAVTTTFISSKPDPAAAATTDAATSAVSSAVSAAASSSGEALLDLSGMSASVPASIPVIVPVPPTPSVSAIPIPDDKAGEMVTYALSGPGIIAFVAVLSLVAFMFLSFAELGPLLRNSDSKNRSRNDAQQQKLTRPFILRVTVHDCNPIVELPEGGVQRLHDGVETVLWFHSHQAADAVAKQLQRKVRKHRPRSTTDENMANKREPPPPPPLEYTLFRLNGLAIKTLAQWPRPINASGAKWPEINSQSQQQTDVDVKPEQLQQMWDEYERIGAMDHVDRQWQDFVKSLGSVSTDEIDQDGKGPCRLCGGSGFTKCYRCGGMYSSNAAQAQGNHLGCDCLDGRRPCEWCSV